MANDGAAGAGAAGARAAMPPGTQPSGAGADLRQVAACLDRQGLGLGDGLPGIPGVDLTGAGLGRPGGLRPGQQAQRRKRHDVLTYGTTLFVVRAGATGGLALRLGNRVVHDRAVRSRVS